MNKEQIFNESTKFKSDFLCPINTGSHKRDNNCIECSGHCRKRENKKSLKRGGDKDLLLPSLKPYYSGLIFK